MTPRDSNKISQSLGCRLPSWYPDWGKMLFHPNRAAAAWPKLVRLEVSWLNFPRLGFVLMLCLLGACGRPPEEKAPTGANPQGLPFDRQPRAGGISPTGLIPSTTKLPEGTPIPVRLQSGLSSASSHAGDTFNAIVDEPVVVDGQTLVGAGTTATGRVLEVKASVGSRENGRESSQDSSHDDASHESSSEPGYLRIVLVSLNVGGKTVAIETSSIFAKGGSREERNLAGTDRERIDRDKNKGDKNKDIEFGVDRHLSFRLAQAVDLQ
jgi:hypothetical protein